MTSQDHSFAKKWLQYTHYEIYIDGERVLQLSKDLPYPVQWLTPYYITGEEFRTRDEKSEIKNISYPELQKLGMCVDVKHAIDKKFSGQQKDYFIKEMRSGCYMITTKLPIDLKIEYDINNQAVRLIRQRIGPTEWHQLSRSYERENWKNEMTASERYKYSRRLLEKRYAKMSGIKNYKQVVINGHLMMITDDGMLLCIPKEGDVRHILFSGTTGSGKTMGLHLLAHNMHYTTTNKIYLLNNLAQNDYQWVNPDENCLEMKRFGFWAAPLPIVFIGLNNIGGSKMYYEDEGLSFRFTLPFTSDGFKDFLTGIPKEREMDLGKSGRYLDKLEFLDTARTDDEILEGLKESLQNSAKKDAIPRNSLPKIANIIGTFVRKGIFDKWSEVPSTWEFKNSVSKKELPPYIGLAEAGLIPSFDTLEIASTYYYSPVMRMIIHNVVEHQKMKSKSENNKAYLLIDEVSRFYVIKNRRLASANILDEVCSVGRNYQLGVAMTIQVYSELNGGSRTNMGFHFAFSNTKEEALEMCRDFGVRDNSIPSIISEDLKRYECVAMSNGMEPFMLYDPITGECKRGYGPYRGRIFIPPSLHKRPEDKIKE